MSHWTPHPAKLAARILRRLLSRRRYFKKANERRQPRSAHRKPGPEDLPDEYFSEE